MSKKKTVEAYMTPNPVTVYENDFIKKACDLLASGTFRHLPVLNSNNKVVGIISNRDLQNMQNALDLIGEAQVNSDNIISVGDVISTKVNATKKEDLLIDVAAIMIEKKLEALPVLQREKLVGIVSYTDILRAFIELSSQIER